MDTVKKMYMDRLGEFIADQGPDIPREFIELFEHTYYLGVGDTISKFTKEQDSDAQAELMMLMMVEALSKISCIDAVLTERDRLGRDGDNNERAK